MFRSATTRIAHNSTVPKLAGISKDLKALQELINAEKSVMQTLQKLSVDIAKAAEALKLWGNGEGDDLGDTLTASTAMILHFASALSRFSQHEGAVREQMKAVRTREENLEEVKRRRKSLVSKAEAADKKLSKMSAENKNFQSQADGLNKLREEIRAIDTELLTEEASLSDFKRSNAKYWMGIKFGALIECCEKGSVIGELGKLAIAEIPLDPTEPGLPRPYYQGHARTEFLVAEAQRSTNEITFSTEPSQKPSSMAIRPLPGSELPPLPTALALSDSMSAYGVATPSVSSPSTTEHPDLLRNRYSQVYMSPNQQLTMLPEIASSTAESLGMQPYLANDSRPSSTGGYSTNPFTPTPLIHPSSIPNEVNEFGAYPSAVQFSPRTTSLRNLSGAEQPIVNGPRGPRFATFPVKGAVSPRPQPPPQSYALPQSLGERAPSLEIERRDSSSFASSVAHALGEDWASPTSQNPDTTKKMRDAQASARDQYSPPPPRYSVTPDVPATMSHAPRQSLSMAAEDDDTALAYTAAEDRHSIRSSAAPSSHGDRHVRFGGSDDDHADPQGAEQTSITHSHHVQEPTLTQADVTPAPSEPPQTPLDAPLSSSAPSSPPASSPEPPLPSAVSLQAHLSELDVSRSEHEDDEKALNAAAAREVSRELDALMFSSPVRPSMPSNNIPSPPASPSAIPLSARGRTGLGQDGSSSPVSIGRGDAGYVRERDRSLPTSPVRSDHTHESPSPPKSPLSTATPVNDTSPVLQPPSIVLRASSPGSMSVETPYRTPSEFPLPPMPAFYNMPALSGSGSFSPGGTRTISAAAFKRQIRSPSSPPPTADGTRSGADVSPLVINKRALPGSPRLPSTEPLGAQRNFSSSNASLPHDDRAGPLNHPPSLSSRSPPRDSMIRPNSMAHYGDGTGEEDDYDYISAYVDDDHGGQPSEPKGGYGQGQFATDLEAEERR